MFFNSPIFIVFLTLSVACYWLFPANIRPISLIIFGGLYYVYSSVMYLLLIIALSLFTFSIGCLLQRRKNNSLWLGVSVLVLVLLACKYLNLFLSAFSIVGGPSLWTAPVIMPLGISFFTFEFIHYLVDIHRGKMVKHSLIDFLSFIFFFPTLISGPIKRFEIFHTSSKHLSFQPAMFWTGFIMILVGYVQKYIFADLLVPFTEPLAFPHTVPTGTFALIGIFLYSIRIYVDFMALSNIAIGSAMLFGILVPKNFYFPYLSTDIAQFWRRWHMSLGSWVRDYLYIPLGGNRVSSSRMYGNLLLVMCVVGLWHGASWNFALWGLYHGIGLALHRFWRSIRPNYPIFEVWPAKTLGCLITFLFVTLGWTFFVTHSIGDSFYLIGLALSSIHHV